MLAEITITPPVTSPVSPTGCGDHLRLHVQDSQRQVRGEGPSLPRFLPVPAPPAVQAGAPLDGSPRRSAPAALAQPACPPGSLTPQRGPAPTHPHAHSMSNAGCEY